MASSAVPTRGPSPSGSCPRRRAELLRRVVVLAGREREATVELVGHLAELDARRLHLAEGYGSLFAYCTGVLRLAEHAAYNRIEAARLSLRFPAILDLLTDGSLNLSTTRLLAPHLRPDNFDRLVARARGRSKREVETLVARLAPRPDVAASVRKLPERTFLAVESEASANLPPPAAPGPPGPFPTPIAAAASRRPAHRTVVAPLAPEGYRVQFTVDAATHEKLRRAQELLRREFHNREPYAIGGEATVANISLRCKAHNLYEGERAFGPRVPASRMDSPRGELGPSRFT